MSRSAILSALDRAAIGLSALCAVHCLVSVVLIAGLSVAGTIWTDPAIHRIGMFGAVLLAGIAFGPTLARERLSRGLAVGLCGLFLMALGLLVPHGWPEIAATITGASLLAVAHLMNTRARD
ncbi:MerC domain-containing protein [Sphingomonas sp. SUN039]|uniref:MerC domain-containing protein n=1 Tax=Sphingomonas sp. SUN039 TaxID=2937787 RepID=UPI002164E8BD|nr:MerC domain-containing protein [Sphingomonas sp. SUN039]UVO54599.1 MerC domain-containing protein [Sphingomonas sp. SUN039]